jgi:hypothetical protein
MNRRITGLVLMVVALASTLCASEWKLKIENGRIKNLTVDPVNSTLGIEKSFEVEVDGAGNPVRGTVVMTNGYTRDMKDGEIKLAWLVYAGPRVMWNYFKDQGKVASVDLSQGPAVGKQTHVVTQNGMEYFGKISSIQAAPDRFTLDVDGNPQIFDKAPVKLIEQMK